MTEAVKAKAKTLHTVGSNLTVGTLTCGSLILSMFCLIVIRINMKCLAQELILYENELLMLWNPVKKYLLGETQRHSRSHYSKKMVEKNFAWVAVPSLIR